MLRPVVAGLWRQHETWDGTYNIDDLLEINDLLDVMEENRLNEAEYLDGIRKR